jgi:hypothetical protein
MTTETESKPNKPAFIAYHVRDGRGEKGFFTRIGAAFANADGKGYNVVLDCLPIDGRITLRVPSDPPESGRA